jgi:mono/diheme cytochrome c family protein
MQTAIYVDRQFALRDDPHEGLSGMRTTLQLTAVAIVLLAIPANGARGVVPLAGSVSAPTAPAQPPGTADVTEGMRLYLQKGDCQACHGWAADGRKMDSQMPDGSNLRETRLDRVRLIQTIKCGRPGTGMPAFDKLAYSDGRCYGMKQADLKSPMPDPPATFQQREIELLVDFLFQKVVGKGPMDRAKCIDYWGSDVEACREFPK